MLASVIRAIGISALFPFAHFLSGFIAIPFTFLAASLFNVMGWWVPAVVWGPRFAIAVVLTWWYASKVGLLEAHRWKAEKKLWIGALLGLFGHLLIIFIIVAQRAESPEVDGNYIVPGMAALACYLVNLAVSFDWSRSNRDAA